MTVPEFPVTIFHNPACGTSRNTVAMVREAGYAPEVVEYLKAGWTASQLLDLSARSGLSLREMMRDKGTPAAELGLLDPATPAEAILAAMVEHPILVNRPLVITPKGVALCRPSEKVLALLDRQIEQFTKEDGEIVIVARIGAPGRS
ncbi:MULTISPECIES: arsenate reductase (glutaredoxin) [unclassified Caulobacter]|uniref:arsenate reductase (glutaredoxin) n=1 Tax=unclassified Caulobacter TaxID=2648921 RepID=UPI000D359330|nr:MULTISPECIES: arsenate reductase (glutaredoxin) [unclassified Caulobacter]PTS88428.1 arsenate reductase (glutaredoxin) [Caulobacter sp. HMWF009]PTT07354.1 arsenate reductase (glutaredoxin) [Caulobacter sp. HMWF025]PTT77418.1 arsenate reductase (glutaredoxin) [Pseudomonas sp. HMWF010]